MKTTNDLHGASRLAGYEQTLPGHPVHLTPRQMEVLALLCEGLPNKLICRRLNISPGTVKAHISSILNALGVGSRLQAVVAARQLGLIVELGAADSECRSSIGRRHGHAATGISLAPLGYWNA